MKKFSLNIISMLLVLLLIAVLPITAAAAPEKYTIQLNESSKMEGCQFSAYRVADLYSQNKMYFSGKFKDFKDFKYINGSAAADSTASDSSDTDTVSISTAIRTLTSYIADNNITPDATTIISKTSSAFKGIEAGVYLVTSPTYSDNNFIYKAQDFLVSVPGNDGSDIVKVNLKVSEQEINKKHNVTVVKVWNDGEGEGRPDSIEVALYKDGAIYNTVTLSEKNSWTYTWSGLSNENTWVVGEPNVPAGYKMTISGTGTSFTITNTKDNTPGDSSTPDDSTPDTSTPDTSTPDTSTPDTSVPDTSSATDSENSSLVDSSSKDDSSNTDTSSSTDTSSNDSYSSSNTDNSSNSQNSSSGTDSDNKTIIDSGYDSLPTGSGTPNSSVSDGLPNTGQLRWPVPVLLAGGLAVLFAGVIINKAHDEEK